MESTHQPVKIHADTHEAYQQRLSRMTFNQALTYAHHLSEDTFNNINLTAEQHTFARGKLFDITMDEYTTCRLALKNHAA